MMAYVLIKTEIGSEIEVLATVKKIKNVIETHTVYGVYDLVVKIKTETLDKLKETVTLNIRRLNKVRSTLTMITIEQF